MKTLTLSVLQRGILMPLLPPNGRRLEMIIIKSIRDKIEFTPEDIQEFELRHGPNGELIGNPKKFKDIELALTNEQITMLKEIPAKVDADGLVSEAMLPLFDQIDLL